MHRFDNDQSAELAVVRRLANHDARFVGLPVRRSGDEVFLRFIVEMRQIFAAGKEGVESNMLPAR